MTQPKIFLVPFGGTDKELATFHYASGLSQKLDAHVSVLHVLPDPQDFFAPYYALYGAPVYTEKTLTDVEAENKKLKNSAEEKIKTASKTAKPAEFSFHSATGRIEDAIALRGRIADAVIMCRGSNESFTDTVGGVLTACARPVIVVPPGEKPAPYNNRVLIAWDGSIEAARAAGYALPYLDSNSTVRIFSRQDGESRNFPLKAQELAGYLKHHGIKAEEAPAPQNSENMTAQQALSAAAAEMDAGLIVMGAYTHHRLKQTVFGGVTKYMLYNADRPVLLAH